jgi:hypothetical protein
MKARVYEIYFGLISGRLTAFPGVHDLLEQLKAQQVRLAVASCADRIKIEANLAANYNKRHHRRGYFWGDRFKSVIVEKGETLINCLAYIDLNPLRAGLVERPEDYRWNSIGYHLQTGNKDHFLSLDFGLIEFGVLHAEERLKLYRRPLPVWMEFIR